MFLPSIYSRTQTTPKPTVRIMLGAALSIREGRLSAYTALISAQLSVVKAHTIHGSKSLPSTVNLLANRWNELTATCYDNDSSPRHLPPLPLRESADHNVMSCQVVTAGTNQNKSLHTTTTSSRRRWLLFGCLSAVLLHHSINTNE
jgi:hypothetical protein